VIFLKELITISLVLLRTTKWLMYMLGSALGYFNGTPINPKVNKC